jgi:hypothetical protein
MRFLEKAMLVCMWWEREQVCRMYGGSCTGCPYDKKDICDKPTTEYVLKTAGEAFAEYFATLPHSVTSELKDSIISTDEQHNIEQDKGRKCYIKINLQRIGLRSTNRWQ